MAYRAHIKQIGDRIMHDEWGWNLPAHYKEDHFKHYLQEQIEQNLIKIKQQARERFLQKMSDSKHHRLVRQKTMMKKNTTMILIQSNSQSNFEADLTLYKKSEMQNSRPFQETLNLKKDTSDLVLTQMEVIDNPLETGTKLISRLSSKT